MSLLQTIETDFLAAMRARSEQEISTLRLLKAALKNAAIEAMHELSDEEIITVMRRQVKQLTEARVDFERGGRADLVQKSDAELALIQKYLPPAPDGAALKSAIREAIAETGATSAKDLGKVMGVVMKKLGRGVDGTFVREEAEKFLTQAKSS